MNLTLQRNSLVTIFFFIQQVQNYNKKNGTLLSFYDSHGLVGSGFMSPGFYVIIFIPFFSNIYEQLAND